MIGSVNGVIIWTHDLVRLKAFYCDVLGLVPHSVRPDFVSFKWGDMRLGLGSHQEVEGLAKDPYRVMVNFHVEDIQATHRTLVGRDVQFVRPPEKEHWGGWVATLVDPDGNLLQLLQQP
jgi:predicted enzyme related to lactoylglutathione lyase